MRAEIVIVAAGANPAATRAVLRFKIVGMRAQWLRRQRRRRRLRMCRRGAQCTDANCGGRTAAAICW
jgi:hypothetical protein